MGRSIPVRYVMKVRPSKGMMTDSVWHVKTRFGGNIRGKGKPNAENLRREAQGLEASTLPGGVNAHLGVTQILEASIVDQFTGQTVATYTRPMFLVLE